MVLLFVYGTLRRAGPMHGLLVPGARFVARARFRGRLYDLGVFPALTPSDSDADGVLGELYEIDGADPGAHLASLDRYEGAQFVRSLEPVTCEDGAVVEAFVYLYQGEVGGGRHIVSGDYTADRDTLDLPG